ncbi:MAG: hypothetical protein M1814_005351 [Vezdaea aestivalis]|nr:MAG: hypothetical protein M1814_005351 [Vezdaea aestivalis]
MKLLPLLLTPLLAFPTLAHTGDSIEIRNQLSRYAIALDAKTFNVLSTIFTPDAVFTFPAPLPPQVTGVQNAQGVLAQSLQGVTTQHSITTTVVDFDSNNAARSTSYLIATYFGAGNLTGKALTYYGTYTDQWVQTNGNWRSKNRGLVLVGPIGDLAAFGQAR